jgi:phospholipid-binding lipoprotein MlaA
VRAFRNAAVMAALSLSLLGGCAAVPGNELGTAPVRSPVPPELAEQSPLDVYDPWEGFNRGVYQFNTVLDRYLLIPAVRVYEFVVPDPARLAVTNFFNNLGELRNGLNSALQLRGDAFGTALGRFMINSTVGMLGLIDIATQVGYPERRTDFGLTLGRWGVGAGPYLVLPALGPSSLRDASGIAVDTATLRAATLNAPAAAEGSVSSPPAIGLYAIDRRSLVQFRYYQTSSPFEYDLVRYFITKQREFALLQIRCELHPELKC